MHTRELEQKHLDAQSRSCLQARFRIVVTTIPWVLGVDIDYLYRLLMHCVLKSAKSAQTLFYKHMYRVRKTTTAMSSG